MAFLRIFLNFQMWTSKIKSLNAPVRHLTLKTQVSTPQKFGAYRAFLLFWGYMINFLQIYGFCVIIWLIESDVKTASVRKPHRNFIKTSAQYAYELRFACHSQTIREDFQMKEKAFDIRKDLAAAATVRTELAENISAFHPQTLIPPAIIAADTGEQNPEDVQLPTVDSKRERRVFINAEKYSTPAVVRQEYFTDLLSAFSARSRTHELKRQVSLGRSHSTGRVLFAVLFPLAILILACAAFVGAHLLGGSPMVKILAFALPIVLGAIGVGSFAAAAKRTPKTKERLMRMLMKHPHQKKIAVVFGLEKLNYDTRMELFRAVSAGLKFNPLITLFITYGNGISDFDDYFNVRSMYLHISRYDAPTQPQPSSGSLVMPLTGIVPVHPQGVAETKQPETIASKTPELPQPPEPPASLPLADTKQVIVDFDFSAASAKEIIEKLRSGLLAELPTEKVFDGAMTKLAKMQEKTVDEYLTILRYTIDKTDFEKADTGALDPKAVTRLAGWYDGDGGLAGIMPLYREAMKRCNYAVVAAFVPFLKGENEQQLLRFVSDKIDEHFVDGTSPEVMQPLATALVIKRAELTQPITAYAKRLTNAADTLAEKTGFVIGFCPLLAATAQCPTDADTETVYSFVITLLTATADSTAITAAMGLIASYKEKFRFLGLSIDALNDIIFGKEFSSIDSRLKYIDNLLTASNLDSDEKTRYINYLTSSKDKVLPRHRATVLCSLLKGGADVSRENVLDAVIEYENAHDEQYLSELSQLLKEYLKANKKDLSLLTDICCQNIPTPMRGEVVERFLTDNPLISVKSEKLLISDIEGLMRDDADEALLYGLATKCHTPKFPRDEFVVFVDTLLGKRETAESFTETLKLLIKLYSEIGFNGDQKHDFKSAVFKKAATFDTDMSIITSATIMAFKVEYISFTEQKIAKQGDADVESAAKALIEEIFKGESNSQ